MPEKELEIKKVQIPDVKETTDELTDAEQDKVTGGGGYGYIDNSGV